MKRQPRVIWTKGMFLSPQHFQSQDQYFADQLQFRVGASNFANYGVTELKVDPEALANGICKVISARGVLPDGETFDMPESDELPASRQVAPHWPTGNPTLDVYLALPERRQNANNVTLPGQHDGSGPPDTRYTSVTRMVPDDNLGADERPVSLGRKTFRLIFDTEFRDGYSAVRIAQLERSPTGVPIVRPSFVPPCLDIAASDYLMSLLRRQVEILLTKSSVLSSSRRERTSAAAGFSASETEKYWLLHTLNSYLPELRHIFMNRRGHPEVAYVAMLRLAGALTTFTLSGGPGDLPEYNHDNLGESFRLLDVRIRDLMDVMFEPNYRAIPLTLAARSIWTGTVPDDNLFKNSQFYLSVSSPMGVAEVIQKVPQYIKMSSPDDIERIVQFQISGLGLRHIQNPQGVPTRMENQYFRMEWTDDTRALWDRVVMSRKLAVYAPGEVAEPKMEVIVVWE